MQPLNPRPGGSQNPPVASEKRSELVRCRGGLIAVPRKLKPLTPDSGRGMLKLTKLLLNVNIQGSLGPVQVVTSPENTVGCLIKEATERYVKEMRRPLLKETNPRCFELHYSEFSLESLRTEEKLKNLGSRNFYLCPKPTTVADSLCTDEAKYVAANFVFPFTKFMDFLL